MMFSRKRRVDSRETKLKLLLMSNLSSPVTARNELQFVIATWTAKYKQSSAMEKREEGEISNDKGLLSS